MEAHNMPQDNPMGAGHQMEPLGEAAASRGLGGWLNERLSLDTFRYEVPAHANTFFYTLGGITMVCVGILAVTGILMTQFYTPVPEMANWSVRSLTMRPFLGSVLRGIHYWTAQVVFVTLILHLMRVFFTGSYHRPREANWLIGVVLAGLMGALYFTGTVLKWDQESFEALEHMVAATKLAGPLGFLFSDKFGAGSALLTRVASLHFVVLPLILLLFLGAHMLLIKKLGISPLPWKTKAEIAPEGATGEPAGAPVTLANSHAKVAKRHTFDRHIKKLVGYGYAVFGLVLALAVLFPPKIGAYPVAGIEVTRPPWVFMWIYSIENWFQIKGLVVVTTLLGLLAVAVPFVDRAKTQSLKDRRWILVAGGLIAVALVFLAMNAYVAKPASHLGM